jgi:DNA processing protein
MPQSEELLAWVVLTRAPRLGTTWLAQALASPCTAADLLAAAARAEPVVAGCELPPALRAFCRSPASRPTSLERRWLEQPTHALLPFSDPRFPPQLRAAQPCPIALYVEGNVAALNDPQIAIVGSRNPTPQGRENAQELAERLARRGLTITSGLAEGIDTAAHEGALAVQGQTIAVLGAGIDVAYPRGNRRLSERIAAGGALVSEFPLAAPARRSHFPQRNRLIAAFGLGTLVVEAAYGSGSLLTAHHARQLGRPVFAVPGSIHNPLARGCHALIKQGAKLTETAADVLSALDISASRDGSARAVTRAAAAPGREAGMDKDHKILLDALGFDPTDVDLLVARTGFKPEAVSSIMLILELEGYVQAAPGGRYSRVARSP